MQMCCKFHCSSCVVDGEMEDGEEEFEDEGVMSDTGDDSALSSVLLKMFVVQPKSLQEVRLAFRLHAKPPVLSGETLGEFMLVIKLRNTIMTGYLILRN